MGNPRGIKIDFEEREQRRLHAIKLLGKGLSQAEIARQLKVSRQSVSRWCMAYEEKGQEGLISADQHGRPGRLSIEQKQKLENILKAGAQKYGYALDLWTMARIKDVIKNEFRVDYHVDHIWKIMKSLGWSWQKPTKRALERDEEKIAHWKKKVWPKIKKKP